MAKYKRILVKISGEALSRDGRGIDGEATLNVAKQLKAVVDYGVQLAVVVGGGNFWRGRNGKMDRVKADQIGMLATVINALALGDALTTVGVENVVYSAVRVERVTAPYVVEEARDHLSRGRVVVFGGGTGSPFFSTDTAAALRACEIKAEAVFCSKAVDGIYDSDPQQNPNAKKYDEISFDKVIADNLKALDVTAIAMCREYGLQVVAFDKNEPNGLLRILQGEKLGTTIS